MKTERTRCLVPHCTRKVTSSRGICHACYATAKRLIDDGRTTWDELVKLNLAAQKRAKPNRLLEAFEAATGSRKGTAATNGKAVKVKNRA
jgi:hypothetical protein